MHRGARTALVVAAAVAVVAAGTGGVGAASGGQSDRVTTWATGTPGTGASGGVAGLDGVATTTVTGNWSGSASTVRVDDTNWTAGGAVRPLGDGYVLGGAAGTGPADRAATVWRLDAGGEVVWTRTFGGPGANATVSALVPVGSDDTVVVGTRHDGATGHDAFAARVGPDGGVGWQWQSDASGAQYGVDAVPTATGDGLGLAVTDAGSGAGDVALVELGGDGSVAWSVVDTVPGDQRAAAIATGDNGTGYLIAGTNRSVAPTDDRALFVRTTADGTVVGRTGVSGDLLGVTRAVTDVRAAADGSGYVGVGSVMATSTDAAVFEADETGITGAVRVGVDPLDERADAFVPRPTADGSVVVGHQQDTAPSAGTAWAAGVAPDGRVDWRRTAVGGSNAEVVTDGEDILVVGTRTDGATGADAVVVTLDPTGPDPFPAGVPGVGSGLAPTDPDDDGIYEDVDGDGAATYDDVVALAFANLTAIGDDQVGRTAFDFDGDGRVTYVDVIGLFQAIGA
jgi:hypothetical protein